MEVNAQRAQKTQGRYTYSNDSIRSQNRADSLALADTTNLQRKLIGGTAPVDTAALARQNDLYSKYSASNSGEKRWIPNSNRTVWLDSLSPGADRFTTGSTGNYLSFMEVS